MVRLSMKQNYAKQEKPAAVNRKHLRLPLGIALEISQVSNGKNKAKTFLPCIYKMVLFLVVNFFHSTI